MSSQPFLSECVCVMCVITDPPLHQAELASLRLELDGARAELDDLRKNQVPPHHRLSERVHKQSSRQAKTNILVLI
jgi:hypothetical protein